MLSPSTEDYLKAILEVADNTGKATTTKLARRLQVTPASVTGMLRKLSTHEPAWVIYEKQRGVRLTEEGRRRALAVVRRHRMIELFLYEELGYSWDEVHVEAEVLEHAASERLISKITEILGFPERDPHGHPIPSEDGTLPETDPICLLDLTPGRMATVAEVGDHDPALLRYLGNLGVYPGAEISIQAVAPFDGPITVRINGQDQGLGRRVAAQVLVELIADDNTGKGCVDPPSAIGR